MYLSPFLLYLVFILDSINTATTVIAILSLIGCGLMFAVGAACTHSDYRPMGTEQQQTWAKAKKIGWRFGILGVFFMLLSTLIPTSRQMAAIIVLPAIVNNENVQKEAGELYQLAKQGLTKLVNDGKEEPNKEEDQK